MSWLICHRTILLNRRAPTLALSRSRTTPERRREKTKSNPARSTSTLAPLNEVSWWRHAMTTPRPFAYLDPQLTRELARRSSMDDSLPPCSHMHAFSLADASAGALPPGKNLMFPGTSGPNVLSEAGNVRAWRLLRAPCKNSCAHLITRSYSFRGP